MKIVEHSAAELEVAEAFKPQRLPSKRRVKRDKPVGYLKAERESRAKTPEQRKASVERNLSLLPVPQPEELYVEHLQTAPEELNQWGRQARRQQYAALETRKDLAAAVLAAGGTYEEAGAHAGVTAGTVSRYLEERDFRDRIEELRSVVRTKVAARIEAWMDRQTSDPEKLDERDAKSVLLIYDRVAGRIGNVKVEQNNVTVYESVMERLARAAGGAAAARPVDDAPDESVGFPVVGVDRPPVAG